MSKREGSGMLRRASCPDWFGIGWFSNAIFREYIQLFVGAAVALFPGVESAEVGGTQMHKGKYA
jgi:hypothetical protein